MLRNEEPEIIGIDLRVSLVVVQQLVAAWRAPWYRAGAARVEKLRYLRELEARLQKPRFVPNTEWVRRRPHYTKGPLYDSQTLEPKA